MNILSERFCMAIAMVALCAAVCYSQDLASDFQQALGTLPDRPRWPSGIIYYDMEDAVDSFVKKHSGTSVVDFLETKVEDPNSRKPALLALAKLAATSQAAEKALFRQVDATRWIIRRDAVIAVAYLDRKDGRRIAETLLGQPGAQDARRLTIDMLAGLGDGDSLEKLKEMRAGEKNLRVRKALGIAMSELEYRLTDVPPAKREEWARQETLCWRTLKESPFSRAPHTEKYLAAKTLYTQGVKFSRYYLKYKLNRRDVLAALIIGNQKQAWVVESLKKYCREKGALGDAARVGLAKTGRNGGLRVLVDSLVTGLPSTVFNHIMSLLRLYGDEDSALFADALSLDQRFSEQERRSLTITYEVIQKRLASKQ